MRMCREQPEHQLEAHRSGGAAGQEQEALATLTQDDTVSCGAKGHDTATAPRPRDPGGTSPRANVEDTGIPGENGLVVAGAV